LGTVTLGTVTVGTVTLGTVTVGVVTVGVVTVGVVTVLPVGVVPVAREGAAPPGAAPPGAAPDADAPPEWGNGTAAGGWVLDVAVSGDSPGAAATPLAAERVDRWRRASLRPGIEASLGAVDAAGGTAPPLWVGVLSQ